MVRRRPPKPTGMKRVLSVVGTALPTAAAKKAAPSSKKGAAGGFALLAAAAGVAFKNRDKLSRLRHQDADSSNGSPAPAMEANNAPIPPSTTST